MANERLVEGWFQNLYKEIERAVNTALAKHPMTDEHDELVKQVKKHGKELRAKYPERYARAKKEIETKYGIDLD